MVTSGDDFWLRMAATATAQAPVPQASVSPAPRSHTRMRRFWESMTLTNSVLMRAGNRGWFSKAGPIFSKSRFRTSSSRKMTQWGFPIETQVIK